jgi:hypothetical protein
MESNTKYNEDQQVGRQEEFVPSFEVKVEMWQEQRDEHKKLQQQMKKDRESHGLHISELLAYLPAGYGGKSQFGRSDLDGTGMLVPCEEQHSGVRPVAGTDHLQTMH